MYILFLLLIIIAILGFGQGYVWYWVHLMEWNEVKAVLLTSLIGSSFLCWYAQYKRTRYYTSRWEYFAGFVFALLSGYAIIRFEGHVSIALRLLFVYTSLFICMTYFSAKEEKVDGYDGDMPDILQRDTPTVADDNHRKEYAQTLVKAIIEDSKKTGIDGAYTINLDEAYGRGKTSFFLMMQDILKDNHILYGDFSPWKNGGTKGMTEALFDLLAEILAPYMGNGETRALYKYASMLLKDFETTKSYVDMVEHIFPINKSTSELFEEIASGLRTLHRPIVIFVDDIDRLRHDELWSLCGLLRDNANFPYLYFIMAADFDYVSTMMADSSLDRCQTDYYLRKIVNLDIHLPKASISYVGQEIRNQFTEIFSSKGVDDNTIKAALTNIFSRDYVTRADITYLFQNMREVKRFFSLLRLDLNANKIDNFAENINILDFFRIELIKHFNRNLYRSLRDEPYVLLQDQKKYYSMRKTTQETVDSDARKIKEDGKEDGKELGNVPNHIAEICPCATDLEEKYTMKIMRDMFDDTHRVPYCIREIASYDNYFFYNVYENNLTYSGFLTIWTSDSAEFRRNVANLNSNAMMESFYNHLQNYTASSFKEVEAKVGYFQRLFYCIGLTHSELNFTNKYEAIKGEMSREVDLLNMFKEENANWTERQLNAFNAYLFQTADDLLVKIAFLSNLQHVANPILDNQQIKERYCEGFCHFVLKDLLPELLKETDNSLIFVAKDMRMLSNGNVWDKNFSDYLCANIEIAMQLLSKGEYYDLTNDCYAYDNDYFITLFGSSLRATLDKLIKFGGDLQGLCRILFDHHNPASTLDMESNYPILKTLRKVKTK